MSFAYLILVSFGDFCSLGQYVSTRADCAIIAIVVFLSCFKSSQYHVHMIQNFESIGENISNSPPSTRLLLERNRRVLGGEFKM